MITTCSTKLSSNSPWGLWLWLLSVWEPSISVDVSRVIWIVTKRRLTKFVFVGIVLCSFVYASQVDAYTVVPQEILTDTVLSKDEGPYFIPWPVTVPVGKTLSIEPGTTLILQGASIYVQGVLNIGASLAEDVLFQTLPDEDDPTTNLSVVVSGGRVQVANVYVDRLSINMKGGVFDMDAVSIEDEGFIIATEQSSLSIQNSTIRGGYINIDTGSKIHLEYSELIGVEKIRVLNQGTLTSNYLHVSGGGGFLIKNKSNTTLNNSIIENISSETAFSLSGQSLLFLEDSYVAPLLSDFALLVDGSSLVATSTVVTNMLQRGIQAIRNGNVSLSGVTLSKTLTETPVETFLVSLVGSTLTATDSVFSETSGNALELYNSNTKPYSTLILNDSTIENYGLSGIYAVQATGTIAHSIVRGGTRGIEHIFSSLTISNSHVSNNSEYGAVAYVSDRTLLAQNNFWGDVSGPYHTNLQPLGQGDAVSDNVLFTPWLVKDPVVKCCSSVMFLPGLMASRLYELDENGSEKMLWEPLVLGGDFIPRLFLDDFGKSLNSSIYTRDVIDETPLPVVGINIYKSFIADINELEISGRVNGWKIIPYDWRLSLYDILDTGYKNEGALFYTHPTTSPYIIEELKRLANESKTQKVTIIAHSNGGLVAKLLMTKLSTLGLTHLVDKLVLIAVPQVGTPQAIGALLHGFGQGIPKDNLPIFASPKKMQQFGFNMPGAYGLLPSSLYFETVFDPVAIFATSSVTQFGDLQSFLRGLNPHLLSYAQNIHEEIDEWLPPAHIETIQIAGWGRDTVKGIRYYQGFKNKKLVTQYDPLFTEDGDQTVVIPSALLLSTSTSHTSRYWLNLKQINKGKIIKRSHADILETEEARDIIKKSILGEPVTYTDAILASSPPQTLGKRLQFLLHSETAHLDLYDGMGNHTGISTTTGSIEENIPESSYGQFGEVAYISVPVGGTHTSGNRKRLIVTTDAPNSKESAYTLDVSQVESNTVATTTSFVDIILTGTSTALLEVPDSGDEIGNLDIDSDADGIVDYSVGPVQVGRDTDGASVMVVSTKSSHRELSQVQNVVTLQNAEALSTSDVGTTTFKNGVIIVSQTASVFNAIPHGKIVSVSFFSSNLKHMKKILGVLIVVGVLGALAFMYITRPVSAPTQDINTVVSSKLPAGSATSSVYRISQEKSLVKFTMNELLNGSPFLVVGTTTQIAGDIAVKDGKFQIGELAINAKTLVTDNSRRDGAIVRLILKSETAGNEFITFKPTSNNLVESIETGKQITFNLSGDLTISGVTKPVVFKVVTTVNEQQVVGTAEVTIKRSDFNLKIPNLSFIANVDDEFPVVVSIVADRIMQ